MQPQSPTTTRFVDGVEEFRNVGGAFDIEAYKHIIFLFFTRLSLKQGGGTKIK